MENDETLHQEEWECSEVEIDIAGSDDVTAGSEEADDDCDEHENETDLETYLSHIVRVKAAKIK